MNARDKEVYAGIANALFDSINAKANGLCPKVPVHIGSNGMTRCAGKVYYRWSPKEGYAEVKIKYSADRRVWAKIVLSPVWIDRGHGVDVLTETLAHEMAHVVQLSTRGDTDHGADFQRFCIALGCNPAQYHNLGYEAEDGRHVYWCRECGQITRFTRNVEKSDGGTCNHCTQRLEKRVLKVYLGTAEQISKLDLAGSLNESRSLRVSAWHERVAAQEAGR